LALRENTHFGPYLITGTLSAPAYGSTPAKDPDGPSSGSERVLRGGALNSNQKGLRVSLRNHLVPVSRSIYVGLRCAQHGTPTLRARSGPPAGRQGVTFSAR
jgi:hypothetical protein